MVGNFFYQSMIFNLKCPCICCQVHVFEKYPNTLLINTIIKYNMNKHSELLFQKSNFSPPPRVINFSNLFITPPKNISTVLRSRGERNTDFVSFVMILPIFAAKRPDYCEVDVLDNPNVRQLRSLENISRIK